MENMDKGLKAPKWVLINWPKTPQMPPKSSAQFVCPSPKVWDFLKKKRLSQGVRSPWPWPKPRGTDHSFVSIVCYKSLDDVRPLTHAQKQTLYPIFPCHCRSAPVLITYTYLSCLFQ